MLFVARFTDMPDIAKRRAELLQEHFDWLAANADKVLLAGSLRTDVGGASLGGLWIIEAKSKSAAERVSNRSSFRETDCVPALRLFTTSYASRQGLDHSRHTARLKGLRSDPAGIRHNATRHEATLACVSSAARSPAEPSFSFRGYTEHSDCRGVLNAELTGGTRFIDALDAELPRGEGIVTRMTGELFSLPVAIYVTCYDNGMVAAVDYIADASDRKRAMRRSRPWRVSSGARRSGGERRRRRRIYRCGNSRPGLREARHGDT
jgi:uncharacterized protein YciI